MSLFKNLMNGDSGNGSDPLRGEDGEAPTDAQASSSRVRKAVFPVAGLGTRFLPATKAVAKEMLPVVDRPLIQYAVDEALAAGIEEMIFITSRSKRAIEDHFDTAVELEQELARNGKDAVLTELRRMVPAHVKFSYVRQCAPLGLGHAVLCAEHAVGREPFAVLLPDDLIDAQRPALAQMVEHFALRPASLLACRTCDRRRPTATASAMRWWPMHGWHGFAASSRSPSRPMRRARSAWWAATCSRRRSSTVCTRSRRAPAVNCS